MPRYNIANDIINATAIEVGLASTVDPVGSTDDNFKQFTGLLNTAGQELIEMYPWQSLINNIDFTTGAADSGVYDLPDDFCYMIDQTGWDRSNSVPIGGPLSAPAWSYLEGRDLVSQSIYASFRLVDNKIDLFPQPPPADMRITFQYISRNWVANQTQMDSRYDTIQTGSDVVLYEPIVIRKFLKVKWLDAKGLPSQAARLDFENIYLARTGHDKGAAVLNAGNPGPGHRYLDSRYNVGDTGYGA